MRKKRSDRRSGFIKFLLSFFAAISVAGIGVAVGTGKGYSASNDGKTIATIADEMLRLDQDTSDSDWSYDSLNKQITNSVAATKDSCGYNLKNARLKFVNVSAYDLKISFQYTRTKNGEDAGTNGTFAVRYGKYDDNIKDCDLSGNTYSFTLSSSANSDGENNFDFATAYHDSGNKDTTISNLIISEIIVTPIYKEYTTVFEAVEHCSYTVSYNGTEQALISANGSKELTNSNQYSYTLKIEVEDDYSLFGWHCGDIDKRTTENVFSYSASANESVRPMLQYKNGASFRVDSSDYLNLSDAIASVSTSTKKTITVINSGVVENGEYTIPEGVTLLVPFDEAGTIYTDKPENDSHGTYYKDEVKPFRTLTLCSGASLIFDSNSSLCVPSKIHSAGGGELNGGSPVGPHGKIEMQYNSKMTMKSGSKLYCWGYITGEGVVEALLGSEVYECFQIEDFRGGSASSALTKTSAFPLTQYYITNIEACLRAYYGAYEYASTALYAMKSTWRSDNIAVIGDGIKVSGLFNIAEDAAYIEKKYDVVNDKMVINFCGGSISVNPLTVMVAGSSIDSANYVLPIHSGILISLKSQAILELSQDICLFPGSSFKIESGCTLQINAGKKLYIYDLEDCRTDGYSDYWVSGHNYRQLSYVSGTENHLPKTRADDYKNGASIDVNGKILVLDGAKLYTTTSGANIFSSEKTGIIEFSSLSESSSVKVDYALSDNDSSHEPAYYDSMDVVNAFLKNSWTVDDNHPEYVSTNINSRGKISFNYNEDHWERDGLLAEEITITFKESKETDSKEFTVVYKKESGGVYTLPNNDFGFVSGDLKLRRWVLENSDNTVSVYKPGETDGGDFGSADIVLYPYWGGEWLKVKNQTNYDYLYIYATSDEIETPASGIETMAAPESTDSTTKLLFNDVGMWQQSYNSTLYGLYKNNKNGDTNYYYVIDGIVDETLGIKEIGASSGYKYCYIGENGYALTETRIYISGSDKLADGFYNIGTNGIIHTEDPYVAGSNACYSSDDTIAYAHGLFTYNGYYYYAKEDGSIVKSSSSTTYETFYVYRTNNKQYNGSNITAGLYCFDSDGRMLDPATLKPMEVTA